MEKQTDKQLYTEQGPFAYDILSDSFLWLIDTPLEGEVISEEESNNLS